MRQLRSRMAKSDSKHSFTTSKDHGQDLNPCQLQKPYSYQYPCYPKSDPILTKLVVYKIHLLCPSVHRSSVEL